ncbi:MAG: RNA 3'-terminal phosphate cyclase [Halieaceae bacterium]|nr:RNA 3'-terminal phosphate cyclase [Halieaceae bacterium]
MIRIDGSQGEGGGQVLRSSLTLSILTQTPFHITRIRANRSKPGLRPQHLAAVRAAAAISRAQVQGADPGSTSLQFRPGRVQPGAYQFDIGTAGSTSLVFQTLFLPLALAAEPSQLTITGGTHVPWSPCYHYLERQWLSVLHACGYRARLRLDQAGFYPKGGGRIRATIQPVATLTPFDLSACGRLEMVSGLSIIANLPAHIARRQQEQVERRLRGRVPDLQVETATLASPGQGTAVFLQAIYQTGCAAFTALGRRGKPAERVADEAVDALDMFLATGAAVDKHLADQLILPLALLPGESTFTTAEITQHLLTNIDVVQSFLPVSIDVQGALGKPGAIRIA